MIDNYDSFTYNIVQYCQELGADIKVVRNDQITIDEIEKLKPQKIIISPGPSTPDDAGITLAVISHFKDKLPILGDIFGGIPLIGSLFKYEAENVSRTEVVFFVTVHLIKDPMDSIVDSQSTSAYQKYCIPEGEGGGSLPEIKTGDIYKGIIPFVLIQLIGLLIVVFFPKLVLLF